MNISQQQEDKYKNLILLNQKLGLDNIEKKFNHNNIIFIYSVPKVGSTSLVSSLKLFGLFQYVIIHIHSETMLETFYNIKNVTVVELINYNAYLKRNVIVIDIYRPPIEHKISTYFEKIADFHFNTSVENINNYSIDKVVKRFNLLFPYLAVGDIFMDVFHFDTIMSFDTDNKYIFTEINTIKFLKLRLDNAEDWSKILKKTLNIDLILLKDHTSERKKFKTLYTKFINTYKIPKNLLEEVMNCKYLQYYFSENDKTKYSEKWLKRSINEDFQSMIPKEYEMYVEISMENQISNVIEKNHYIYNGCLCKACLMKRNKLIKQILCGDNVENIRIIHEEANKELATIKHNKIKNFIRNKTISNTLTRSQIKTPALLTFTRNII